MSASDFSAPAAASPSAEGGVRVLLRLEGFALLLAALALYVHELPLWA